MSQPSSSCTISASRDSGVPPALGSSAKAGEQPRGWRALLARRLALHFVPERTLAQAIAGAGCSAVETEMAGRFFAYAGAAR